jgi:large subunit ribosomal protein L24
MIAKQKLKKDDMVIVITGKDKGKKGKILKMFPSENKAIVEGVNRVKKHKKATRDEPGSIIEKEAKIQVSNIAYIDSQGKPSKLGLKFLEDGKKVRFVKTTGEVVAN